MLFLKTLGPLEISDNGRNIRLPRAKDRALLAFLAVNSKKSFTRDYLADLLWEGPDAAKSRHSLSQSLYAIRRLAPKAIKQNLLIRINDAEVQTDVDVLNQAVDRADTVTIAALIQGPFLADLCNLKAEQFNSWRDEIEARYARQLEEAGPTSNANAILARTKSLTETIGPLDEAVSTERPFEDNKKLHLIGRENEFQVLRDAYQRASAGQPSFVVVCGPPGFGKSSLVHEFTSECGRDALIIHAKCYHSERRVGFAPVIRALSPHISHDLKTELGPMWSSTLAELFPDASAHASEPIARLSAQAAQARLFEAITLTIRSLCARRPLVMFFDDVQWSDQSTRALLGYISHRLSAGHVMIVAARRAEHGIRNLPAPWNEWLGIELKELTEANVFQLLDVHDKKHLDPKQLFASTRGHPYLLSEVIKEPTSDNTKSGGDAESFVSAVLRTLPPGCQKVAAVCATIGRPATPQLIAKVTANREVGNLLDRLTANGLLVVEGKRVVMSHDIIREAAYSRIPPFTRSRLHERIANALDNSAGRAGERAEHYYFAGNRRRAFVSALKAAKFAGSRHAYAEAVYFIRLAIRSSGGKKPILRWRLIQHLERMHRLDAAFEELQVYIQLTRSTQDEVTIKHLALGYQTGRIALEELKCTLDDFIANTTHHPRKIQALSLALRVAYHSGEPRSADKYARALREVALTMDDCRDGFEAVANAARVIGTTVSAAEGNSWIAEVERDLESIKDNESRLRTTHYIAHVKYNIGDLRTAARIFDDTLKECDRIGAADFWPLTAAHAHMVHVELGDYNTAERIESELSERSRAFEAAQYATVEVACNGAMMRYEQENYEAAYKKANEGLGLITNGAMAVWIELGLHTLAALCELEWGQINAAMARAARIRDELNTIGHMAGDCSYTLMLLSRIEELNNNRHNGIAMIKKGIADFRDRDLVCRLRLELELARIQRKTHRSESRELAKEVYETARSIGARPLAERADSLLMRI